MFIYRARRGIARFNDQFTSRSSEAVGEAETRVASVAKKTKKKPELSGSRGSSLILEELRDSKSTRPKITWRRDVIGSSDQTESLPVPVANNVMELRANPIERYLESSQSVLELHPSILALHTEIVHAKDPFDILTMVDDSSVSNSVTALHCIASRCNRQRSRMELVKADHRFQALLDQIGNQVDFFAGQPVARGNVFWSLVKMNIWRDSPCTLRLIGQMVQEEETTPVSIETIVSILYAVADAKKAAASQAIGKELSSALDRLIDAYATRIKRDHIDSISTSNLVSVVTSLARIGRSEPSIMKALGDRVIERIDTVSIEDLTSILWAFTSLKMVDSTLYSRIQSVLESRAPTDCSRRNLVDLVWALAKGRPSNADGSLSELFRYTFAPLIRNHMIDLSVRELCTVLWSFATAEVVDFDFYNDLAHALIPRVSEMNAHDVSSVVWGLAGVHFSHCDLFKSIKRQASLLHNDFTPLQLSRVVYGLGAAGVVMPELVEGCRKRMHLLYTQNIVEILMGLNHCGLVQEMGGPFFETLSNQTQKISGRDAVQVLKILGSISDSYKYKPLIESLEEIVKTRFNCSGRWIPNGYDFCDMTEAIGKLNLTDSNLVEIVLCHLGTVYKSPSFTPDLFLRFLVATSSFQKNSTALNSLKKIVLLKEKGIQVAFSTLSRTLLVDHASNFSIDGAIDIMSMYAKIGYADDSVIKLAELIEGSALATQEAPSVDRLISLAVSLAQLQIAPDFAFKIAEMASDKLISSGIAVSIDSVIDLIWSRLSLGEDPDQIPSQLVELVAQGSTEIPKNISRAKQVCLSMESREGMSKYAEEVLKLRFSSLAKPSKKKGISGGIDKYESLISFALSELGVKHKLKALAIPNLYTVSATLTSEGDVKRVCVDLLSPTDVVAPRTDKWTGEAILKKIHLINAGWTVVSVTMPQVQKALEAGSLKPVIADLIAPYNDRGKSRVSFKSLSSTRVVDDFLSQP